MRACSAVPPTPQEGTGAGSANRFQNCLFYAEQALAFGPSVPERRLPHVGKSTIRAGVSFRPFPVVRAKRVCESTPDRFGRPGSFASRSQYLPRHLYTTFHGGAAVPNGRRRAVPAEGVRSLGPVRTDRPCTAGARSVLPIQRLFARPFGDGESVPVWLPIRRPPAFGAVPTRTQRSRVNACLNVPAPLSGRGWGPAQRGRCPAALRSGPNCPMSFPMHGLPSIVDRTRLTRRSHFCVSVGPCSARPGTPPHTYVQRNCRQRR